MSRTAVSKWFDGGGIEAENIFPIADYCGVEARWLAIGEGPKHGPTRDGLFGRLLDLWPWMDEATKGEIVGIATARTKPPSGAADRPPKSA